MASCAGKLNHLGLEQGPKRTTLACANEHRSWKIYEETFYHLLGQARQYDWGKRKFRFKNRLFSMDATFIELCLSLFDWAHFRRAKGAVTFAHMTDGKTGEVRIAKGVIAEEFPFPAGSIVVFDKGYTDYALFNH